MTKTAIHIFIILSLAVSIGYSQGSKVKIYPNRPGVEIVYAGTEGTGSSNDNGGPSVLLRLRNNMKWGLRVCTYSSQEVRNGVVGINYEVDPPPAHTIRSRSSEEPEPERIDYPAGIPTFDSCDPFTIKSGRSVLFRVYRAHLVDKTRIRVDFFYEWEDVYESRTGREPSHSVRFYSGNAGSPATVSGSCAVASSIVDPKVFETVSDKEIRTGLKEAYDQFIKYYCERDFASIYKLLWKSYIKSVENIGEAEFVRYKREHYSDGKSTMESFIPEHIAELGDQKERTVNTWVVQGCLTEKRDGKVNRRQATFDMRREGEQIVFTDISLIRISLDGKTMECAR